MTYKNQFTNRLLFTADNVQNYDTNVSSANSTNTRTTNSTDAHITGNS